MDKKEVTIYDIAERAEVSTATVSRVIAGNYPVSKKTREKVLKVIEQYDFHPNALARSLSSNKANVIGFITPDIRNPFFSQIFLEVEKHAHKVGYSVMLCNSENNRDLESKYIRMLLEHRTEAIVLLGGLINDINPESERVSELNQIAKKTKLVMINGKIKGIDCFSIRTDEGKGIELVLDHLIEQGHTKIGLVGGFKSITTTAAKLKSFKSTLEKRGLVFNSDWVISSNFDIESGQEALKKLVEKNEDLPTALIGINDMVAIGMLKENFKTNLPPFTIVGYDNTQLSIASNPELTTVGHPYEEIGEKVIDVIVGNEIVSTDEIILEPKLIIRESTLHKVDLKD